MSGKKFFWTALATAVGVAVMAPIVRNFTSNLGLGGS
jgi:hypothetical protein